MEILDGTYVASGSNQFSYRTMKISKMTSTSFEFDINAQNGADSEQINGTAFAEKAGFVFRDDEYKNKCTLIFTYDKKVLSLEDVDSNCAIAWAGYMVYFQDEYIKDGVVQQVSMERFFEDKKDFDLLKRLVGRNISLFEDTAGSGFDEDILGIFNSKVKTFSVRGLHTIFENIVMVSPDGKVFAAVIDPEKDVVLYFTNVFEYKNKLPERIESWRSGFKDKKVVYNLIKI